MVMPRSPWTRAVHERCLQLTAAAGKPVGLTVREALALLGSPGRSTGWRLMERAAQAGCFSVLVEPSPAHRRGMCGRYFAVGTMPPPSEPKRQRRTSTSYFAGLQRASSIFDLASKCNSETTK